jgi:hypothetical protein
MRGLLGVTLALTACAPLAPPLAVDGGPGPDAPTDAVVRPPRTDAGSTVYAPCAAAEDCPPGFFCDTEFPAGQCSLPCMADDECPEEGRCFFGSCYRGCRRGGGSWCRHDQLCLPTEGVCFASCTSRLDMPELACSGGLTCVDNHCTTSRGGAGAIGAACTTLADCATRRCIRAEEGFPDGMCVRLTRMVAIDEWLAPGPMPVERCPDGTVVGLGPTDHASEGENALCLPRCVTDGDCRDGYYCERRGVWSAPVHDDGYCSPWRCDGTPLTVPPCAAPNACVDGFCRAASP